MTASDSQNIPQKRQSTFLFHDLFRRIFAEIQVSQLPDMVQESAGADLGAADVAIGVMQQLAVDLPERFYHQFTCPLTTR